MPNLSRDALRETRHNEGRVRFLGKGTQAVSSITSRATFVRHPKRLSITESGNRGLTDQQESPSSLVPSTSNYRFIESSGSWAIKSKL